MASQGYQDHRNSAEGRQALTAEAIRAPGKVTRSDVAPVPSQAVPEQAPVRQPGDASARMEDWDATSLMAAMGLAPGASDPLLQAPLQPLQARATRAGVSPAPTAAAGATGAQNARSPRSPRHSAPSHASEPTAAPLDLTADAAGPAPNAHMLVRALDKGGDLLDLWTGPAYFLGELPTSYQGRRSAKGWTWTSDGAPAPQAARLKVNSDARGVRGSTVAAWAPPSTTVITVDFVPLTAPFGAAGHPLADEPTPSGARAPFVGREADGSAPLASATAAAATALDGPRPLGTFRDLGDLTVLDEDHGSTVWLADGYVHLHGKPTEYLYRVAPQTSPRQRLVQITATSRVAIDAHAPTRGTVELVPQVRRVSREELDALRLADRADPSGDLAQLRRPEITASGNSWKVALQLGCSVVLITALSAEARFAYYVDPDWTGNQRAVHIVATPGVRIDEAPRAASDDDDPRTLVANPIYVQDPRLVPRQGEPIEPSRYLGIERHDNVPANVLPTSANRAAFTIATGGTGITVRDLESGAALTLRADDPTLGARYLHEVEGRQVRALVSKHARVEITQVRPAPIVPTETPDPFFDFGQVEFLLYRVDREDRFPEPGTALTPEILERFGHRIAPDSVQWLTTQKPEGQQVLEAVADGAISASPGLGDLMDLLDLAAAATAGTDKWGNPLSRFEKVAIAVTALLPFVTAGAVMAGKRLTALARASKAAAPLTSLASKLGRSEVEIQALVTSLRRLDDEGRAAARRIEQAVSLGDHVSPADLARFEHALAHAGARVAPTGLGAGAQAFLPRGHGAVATASIAKTSTKATRTAELVAVERPLQQALHAHARKLGLRGAARRARVEVLPKVAFVQRFESEQARAVFQLTDRGPVIYARADATAADMLDEAAHLAQLADDRTAPTMRLLDERNLADWPTLSVSDKLEFYHAKLDVELDAKRRTLRAIRDEPDRALAQGALEDLERRQAEVAAISPEDLTRMNAGELPPPSFLDQAPRMFGKQRRVREEVPALHVRGQGATLEPREVSRTKGSSDYSSAYSASDVQRVRQRGNTWREVTYVTSDLDGRVASRTLDETGATRVVVAHGAQRRTHILEPGAEIEPAMVPGRKVKHGDRLGRDSAREYRSVEVRYADGRVLEREEIKSHADGRSWVQRGSESTARGSAAEAAARAAADADLAKRIERKEISSAFHIPHKVGGGGFDDVIVEFSGEGAEMQAKVRIREVKDYANRHVSFNEFSALVENFESNRKELLRSIDGARLAARQGLVVDEPFSSMSHAQIASARRAVADKRMAIEIVLGMSTKVGQIARARLRNKFSNLTITHL